MSILDKYPPPWVTANSWGDIEDGSGLPVVAVSDSCDNAELEYGHADERGDDVKRLILAAPRLLRALSNIVVMVDGPAHHRAMAIADAEALIAEIEGT